MMYQGLIWPSETEAEGLTFFGIIPSSEYCSTMRQKEMQTLIKNSHENNTAETDIEFWAKQEFYFPENIYEFEVQLLTYISLIGLISGYGSVLSAQLSTWITHFH
jgi:hypothetical protein